MTAMPASFMRATTRNSDCASFSDSEEVGSSSTMIFGERAYDFAISTICC